MHISAGWSAEVGAVLAASGPGRGQLTLRLVVALALTYALGFERELRGSEAGDRTFAVVGLGAAVIGVLALEGAPNALAGVVTGIGFLGAGVILHGAGGDMVKGVTTAATFFLAAAVGAAAGQGHLLLAAEATVGALFLLEICHIPVLRSLDGRHWARRFADDPRSPDPPP